MADMKKKVLKHWTRDEKLLIELVKQNPKIYMNPASPSVLIWNTIADIVGMSATLCKKKWQVIRKSYTDRVRKSKVWKGESTSKFLDGRLEFLNAALEEKNKEQRIKMPKTKEKRRLVNRGNDQPNIATLLELGTQNRNDKCGNPDEDDHISLDSSDEPISETSKRIDGNVPIIDLDDSSSDSGFNAIEKFYSKLNEIEKKRTNIPNNKNCKKPYINKKHSIIEELSTIKYSSSNLNCDKNLQSEPNVAINVESTNVTPNYNLYSTIAKHLTEGNKTICDIKTFFRGIAEYTTHAFSLEKQMELRKAINALLTDEELRLFTDNLLEAEESEID